MNAMRTELLDRLNRWMRGGRRRGAIAADDAPAPPVVESDAGTDRDLIVPRLCAEPWYVDKVAIEGDRLYAAGWSMAVPGQPEPPQGWFTVNGRRFDAMRYPFPRPDVGAVFWMREGASLCGFEGTIERIAEPYPDGVLEIRRIVADTPGVERGRDSWFKPDPALHANLPDEDRRFRVIGDRDPNGFLISGATDFHRIDRAALGAAGRRLHEFDRVLDWGAGCGRVARHFPVGAADRLTGCDIDGDNVDWCAANLRGTFVRCAMSPPLPFPDASFDAVYGVSVFTHMREPMQLLWLEELARITAPGAWVFVTVHGRTAIDFSRPSPSEYRRLLGEVASNGIVFNGANTQLDGHAEHGGEYVNVLHGSDYIRRVWSRFFAVEHILPGYILHHDLVVLRKP